VVENDPKAMAEHRKKFIKRLIAFVLLFFTPVFINMILSWNLSNYGLNGNVYTCNTPYAFSIKTWNSTYIPPVDNAGGGSGSGSNNGDSDLGLSANNGLFAITETSPMASGGNQYYDTSESNAYECVWYAKSRAIEALSTSSDSEKDTKISKIKSSYGHGWMWFHLAVPGEQTAIGNSESLGSLDSLVGFKYSSDANKPRAGSLVSWRWSSYGCSTYWSKRGRGNSCSDSNPEYGHVGFVEDVDTSNNKVMISEGWNNGGSLGFACNWYTFDEMESKGGRYDFQGYVYLFDSLDK
jgi:surface antigen